MGFVLIFKHGGGPKKVWVIIDYGICQLWVMTASIIVMNKETNQNWSIYLGVLLVKVRRNDGVPLRVPFDDERSRFVLTIHIALPGGYY